MSLSPVDEGSSPLVSITKEVALPKRKFVSAGNEQDIERTAPSETTGVERRGSTLPKPQTLIAIRSDRLWGKNTPGVDRPRAPHTYIYIDRYRYRCDYK